MMWQVDYFMMCDHCQNIENVDGKTKAQATKTARDKGWLVTRKETVCPKCHQKLRKFHSDARAAEAR
jgi:hypothetical protein